jgi:hypothetical protein
MFPFFCPLTYITLHIINANIKMIPNIIPGIESIIRIVIKQIGYKKREDIASLSLLVVCLCYHSQFLQP